MKIKLLFLLAITFFTFSSCKKELPPPSDFAEPIPGDSSPANLIKGKWIFTSFEENTYLISTGQNIGTRRGEEMEAFSFGNNAYSRDTSPYRKFVYVVSVKGNAKPGLHLEEYDANYYSTEISNLTTNSMVWKITFQGNNARSVKNMYFKR